MTVKTCNDCGRASRYFNRCETKFCPICAPRLARERREAVEWWAKNIRQPKHVVLTARNTAELTKARIQHLKRSFTRLRRRRFARNWAGGFFCIEITNEGRGWHVHLHALVDARFIAADVLAKEWAEVIGQDFAIVKVCDARTKSYLHEVCKYAVKGNDMAGWTGEDIATLFDACEGVKMFQTFGSLYKLRADFREFLDAMQGKEDVCDCGACNWKFESESEAQWAEIRRELDAGPCAPPLRRAEAAQSELFKAQVGTMCH